MCNSGEFSLSISPLYVQSRKIASDESGVFSIQVNLNQAGSYVLAGIGLFHWTRAALINLYF